VSQEALFDTFWNRHRLSALSEVRRREAPSACADAAARARADVFTEAHIESTGEPT
jgi:hypothetical protein